MDGTARKSFSFPHVDLVPSTRRKGHRVVGTRRSLKSVRPGADSRHFRVFMLSSSQATSKDGAAKAESLQLENDETVKSIGEMTVLVQNSQNSDSSPRVLGEEESQRLIVEALKDLKAKAESQLAGARQTGSQSQLSNAQSLEDDLTFDAQSLEASKKSLAGTNGE